MHASVIDFLVLFSNTIVPWSRSYYITRRGTILRGATGVPWGYIEIKEQNVVPSWRIRRKKICLRQAIGMLAVMATFNVVACVREMVGLSRANS